MTIAKKLALAEQICGHTFKNRDLLQSAITHPSAVEGQPVSASYERLEFLGDSILGFKAHMGAGSITSNVKSDKLLVKVHAEDGDLETGMKKFGAMVGDRVEVGCGSILNPGTVIGRDSNIYPLSSVRGCVDGNSIYKKQGEVAEKHD